MRGSNLDTLGSLDATNQPLQTAMLYFFPALALLCILYILSGLSHSRFVSPAQNFHIFFFSLVFVMQCLLCFSLKRNPKGSYFFVIFPDLVNEPCFTPLPQSIFPFQHRMRLNIPLEFSCTLKFFAFLPLEKFI